MEIKNNIYKGFRIDICVVLFLIGSIMAVSHIFSQQKVIYAEKIQTI